jgi:hypothetical protein
MPLLCVEQSLYNTFLQLLPEALVVVVVARATPVRGAVSTLVDSLLTGRVMLRWLVASSRKPADCRSRELVASRCFAAVILTKRVSRMR